MAYILRMLDHLSARPIGPIIGCLDENEENDETALRLMCIIDYELERRTNFYKRISETKLPKLLHELLGFHSYKSFQYYDYIGNCQFNRKYLHCKYGQCQFFGPYMLVMTHMAINHNMHCGIKLCAYCCHVELKLHFAENSFQKCYEKYLKREEISDIIVESSVIYEIISDFYNVIKDCSIRLGVRSRRQLHNYSGKGFGTAEQLAKNYGGYISKETIVFQPKLTGKPILIDQLNKEFHRVMIMFYGPTRSSQFKNEVSKKLCV